MRKYLINSLLILMLIVANFYIYMYNNLELKIGGTQMNNYLMLLEASTSASGKGSFQMIFLMVLLFVGMYFLMIRPQKKQQKKEQEIRENTQVGDETTTIGGIVGKVVTVKEDSLIIETGADKNKMKITRWAIQTNVTANEKIKAEREAAKAAALKAKEEKAKEKADKKNKD